MPLTIEEAFFSLSDRLNEMETNTCNCAFDDDMIHVIVNTMIAYKRFNIEDRIIKMKFWLGKIESLYDSVPKTLPNCETEILTLTGLQIRRFNKQEEEERKKQIFQELDIYKEELEKYIEDDTDELIAKQGAVPNSRVLMLDKDSDVKSLSLVLSALLEDVLTEGDKRELPTKVGRVIINNFCLHNKRDTQINLKHASHAPFVESDYVKAEGIIKAMLHHLKIKQIKDPD